RGIRAGRSTVGTTGVKTSPPSRDEIAWSARYWHGSPCVAKARQGQSPTIIKVDAEALSAPETGSLGPLEVRSRNGKKSLANLLSYNSEIIGIIWRARRDSNR